MTPKYRIPLLTSNFVGKSLKISVNKSFTFSKIQTDSRTITKDSLFVPIKGDTYDGHEFIEMAVSKGASGILYRNDFQLPCQIQKNEDILKFPVNDTITAYRKLAADWRQEFNIPVVAVAGSVGKTTTKEFLAAIMSGKWITHKTSGSQNGFVGIPMTVLDIDHKHEAAVIEVGIDEPDSMDSHMSIVNPDAVVLTAIGPEHLFKLKDITTVAREECKALEWVAKMGGIVAVNLDDPLIAPWAGKLQKLNSKTKIIAYSLRDNPSDGILSGKINADGHALEINGTSFPLPLPGLHNAKNLLGALAIATGLGLSNKEILKGLKYFKQPSGRTELKPLPNDIQVICDYYNASPPSVSAGLDLLTECAGHKNRSGIRWACLADMLELGPEEGQFHRDLAKKIIHHGIEHVLLYGNLMKHLFNELKSSGYQNNVLHFNSHEELAKFLQTGVSKGDCILIKGSRGMKMEKVWEAFNSQVK